MRLLDRMVQRMYAALTTGPAINCRPHNSRQRIDLDAVAKLDGSTPASVLSRLLDQRGKLTLAATRTKPVASANGELSPEMRAELAAFDAQQTTLKKLGVIADDARTYEQDTGAHALQLGFPVLHLPPRDAAPGRTRVEKRILAPIAFVPISVTVRLGRVPAIDLACAEDGIDRVFANTALLAWLEQQLGRKLGPLFEDPEGTEPWREIQELVALIREALQLGEAPQIGPELVLRPTPRAEDAGEPGILACGIVGLFPLANQSLLRDLEAMSAGEVHLQGPVESFTRVDASAGRTTTAQADTTLSRARRLAGERLVSQADPCQARAVELARSSRSLVVHGPPGTGKSQTIANIIGDHLARGERVLFVCDKRTALDVVHYRLAHLGLDRLCAIVHDAQRDQRELYRSIREQLDSLAETRTNPRAETELGALDRELQSLHDELARHAHALSEAPAVDEPSFHTICGEWLSLRPEGNDALGNIAEVDSRALVSAEKHVREVLDRGRVDELSTNPWRGALGIRLEEYLAQPQVEWQRRIGVVLQAATAADDTASELLLPFQDIRSCAAAGRVRAAWADRFESGLRAAWPSLVGRAAATDGSALAHARSQVAAISAQLERAREPLDAELAIVHRAAPISAAQAAQWLGALLGYAAIGRKWYAGFLFGRRRLAREVLGRFGLDVTVEAAERLALFLEIVRARAIVRALWDDTLAPLLGLPQPTEESLVPWFDQVRFVLDTLATLDEDALLAFDAAAVRASLADPGRYALLFDGLRRAVARADAITALDRALIVAGLFEPAFRSTVAERLCRGECIAALVAPFAQRLSSVEGLLRLEQAARMLPGALRHASLTLAERRVSPEDGWLMIRRGVLGGELARRIHQQPDLLSFDADKLRTYHARWREVDGGRRERARDMILHRWSTRQRERLLASTGTRLSSAGAELKRRLTLRGERAMRLRQVIATGVGMAEGDPLFDIRPVWMASPETVAQVFPRAPIFDVIVFDEASQCRLEEALPVLLRAKRVVIAGDPKQLPPTRFFESAVAQSHDVEPETDQDLFEAQQSEIEDLLAAALNLEVDQCYLDVHYRSRNSDLIEFSNRSFYDRRLQSIPGHPSRRSRTAPLRLIRVDGAYEDRRNPAEAQKVVELVGELLARENPPSIGIACFNLTQRDAIVEALDEAAARDAKFGDRLAAARLRRGAGSFEGLFVKNLENVQGDERDHMIISTTYGRDPKGKFHRRFGPLGMAGGGRRLNVLVTRARDEVHIVTSIPREVYLAEWPLQPGQAPNGGLLLFQYLRWAETLEAAYADELATRIARRSGDREPLVVYESECGSRVAEMIGRRLVDGSMCAAEVHWGNDGFCIDVAVQGLDTSDANPIGVLCDGARFDKAVDRVEWDLFRTAVLEGQGWEIHRISSPQIFRDLPGTLQRIASASRRASSS